MSCSLSNGCGDFSETDEHRQNVSETMKDLYESSFMSDSCKLSLNPRSDGANFGDLCVRRLQLSFRHLTISRQSSFHLPDFLDSLNYAVKVFRVLKTYCMLYRRNFLPLCTLV